MVSIIRSDAFFCTLEWLQGSLLRLRLTAEILAPCLIVSIPTVQRRPYGATQRGQGEAQRRSLLQPIVASLTCTAQRDVNQNLAAGFGATHSVCFNLTYKRCSARRFIIMPDDHPRDHYYYNRLIISKSFKDFSTPAAFGHIFCHQIVIYIFMTCHNPFKDDSLYWSLMIALTILNLYIYVEV